MPTPSVTIVHPDRPGDERIVSTAAFRAHEKAGWTIANPDPDPDELDGSHNPNDESQED